MDDANAEILSEFLSESEEHLEVLNDKMLDVEASIKNNTEMSTDDLNAMFRSAHTIKGTASFIELHKVVSLTHKAETLLQKLRDKEVVLTSEMVDALFSAFDTLTELLNALKEEHSEERVDIEDDVKRIEIILDKPAGEDAPTPEPETPVEEKATETPDDSKSSINEKYLDMFIEEGGSNLDDFEQCLLKAEDQENNNDIVASMFRSIHTLKGSAGVIKADQIIEVSHKMENLLSYFREKELSIDSTVISLLFKGTDAIKEMMGTLRSSKSIEYDVSEISSELDSFAKNLKEGRPASEDQVLSTDEPVDDSLFDLKNNTENENKTLRNEISIGKDPFLVKLSFESDLSGKSMKYAILEQRLIKNGTIVFKRPYHDDEAMDKEEGEYQVGILYTSELTESDISKLCLIDGITLKDVVLIDKSDYAEAIPAEEPVVEVIPEPKEELVSTPEENTVQSEEKEPVNDEPVINEPIKEEIQESIEVAPQKVVEQPKGDSMIDKPKAEDKVAAAAKSAPIELSTIKIDSKKLDKLMNLSGELVIVRAQYARLSNLFNNNTFREKEILANTTRANTSIDELNRLLDSLDSNSDEDRLLNRVKKIVHDLKADIGLLDDLIKTDDFVDNIHQLSETTNSLEKLSSDIQEGIMQTRMVPIEGVFTRFKRVVRDISKEIGKEVNLEIYGADTELDKKIVDSLGDPLTHMIRNAVDHGIDDKDSRIKLGKPEAGTVILKASHKGNNICIEISDDGKGIDHNRLSEIALNKGILTEEQLERMTEKEKLNIMFMPGFSTAEKVTGLSGRGVGMDVVRSMITSLNGVVDIETEINVGSSFYLKIPLTLAIIQALLVKIGEQVYAFPIESISEIISILPEDIYSIDGNATVKLRDHALSLIKLEDVINITNTTDDTNKKRNQKVVIISDGESELGVIVDSLVGKDEIVIKPFTEHFKNTKGMTGASILADGSVSLILDPVGIIGESR